MVAASLFPGGVKGSRLLCFNRKSRKAKRSGAKSVLNDTSAPVCCAALTGVKVSNLDRLVRVAVLSLARPETAQVVFYRDRVTRKMQQKRSDTVALAP